MGPSSAAVPAAATTSRSTTAAEGWAFGWDPDVYSRFGGLRLRPALDLLGQVHHGSPQVIYDIGTGRGQIARLMADRWPDAEVIGTDTSAAMLDEARADPGRVRWVLDDVRRWDPPTPSDIIYSNAVLHWVPDHDGLLLRLLDSLRPGGVLAVQMPLSWHEPSHRLMRTVLAEGGGLGPIGPDELRERIGRLPVGPPDHYHRLLSGTATQLNVWQTTYYQQLHGENAVLEWVRGSALRPIIEGLGDAEGKRFLELYSAALTEAYPPEPDGSTLYPFPRVFFVATR